VTRWGYESQCRDLRTGVMGSKRCEPACLLLSVKQCASVGYVRQVGRIEWCYNNQGGRWRRRERAELQAEVTYTCEYVAIGVVGFLRKNIVYGRKNVYPCDILTKIVMLCIQYCGSVLWWIQWKMNTRLGVGITHKLALAKRGHIKFNRVKWINYVQNNKRQWIVIRMMMMMK